MPKGRRAQKPRPNTRVLLVVGLTLLVGGAVGYAALREDAPTARVDLRDVHGIAASPTEPGVVFIATHEGILRHEEDVGWSRVGAARDDFMGFTMHPTDGRTFWTSGHPVEGGNMGVRRSTDGGASWETLWREPVDLHAMAVSPADADRLWGWWRGDVIRSDDGGATWDRVGSAPAIRAFAGHPRDADVVYAATGTGMLRSGDGGATWTPLAGLAAFGIAVAPEDKATPTMYAGSDGGLWRSRDGGASWSELPAPEPGTYAYLSASATEPDVVYAATYQKGVYKSADAGDTWRVLRAGGS